MNKGGKKTGKKHRHFVNCEQKMDFGATGALYGCGEDMGWAQHGM